MNSYTFSSILEVNGKTKNIDINQAFCIGYSGRDKEKTMAHIKELAEIGVPEPAEIPALFPVGINTVTQEDVMEVIGDETSGEAEIVLVFGNTADEVYLTVGSDHTDRALETVDINKSKQVCGKPFAKKAWIARNLKQHWDQLVLSSAVRIDGKWQQYQSAPIASIIDFNEIKRFLIEKNIECTNCIVFCGTVPLQDGFKFGDSFYMKLEDPVHDDSISAEYKIKNILR